jgi:hypothetical protein
MVKNRSGWGKDAGGITSVIFEFKEVDAPLNFVCLFDRGPGKAVIT